MRPGANAAVSVERFFQFALLGLVASGYLAVAGSGYLDVPTIALTGAGLALRALLVAGAVRLRISDRAVTLATLAYMAFFPLDYLVVSKGFLEATVHLVFFLAVVKILTARTNRDYASIASIAFLELMAAAILSARLNFFVFLSLYLLFAMAAFTSSEIRRSVQRPQAIARTGLRHFHLRLAALTLFVTTGILGLTGGLFFMLPRTAGAALNGLVSTRLVLPGFSNQVNLGQIGEVQASSEPVMHVEITDPQLAAGIKWRGAALSRFDGRRWSNPATATRTIPVEEGRRAVLASYVGREGRHVSYGVTRTAADTDALFLAGLPEVLELRQPFLYATVDDNYRVGRLPEQGFRYNAYALIESPAYPAALAAPPEPAPEPVRARYLQLPLLDPRIPALARSMTAGEAGDAARARALEAHLRNDYGYTLELPSREVPDPLAHFLFERRKGHCEYFASAMAVMLRTLGIPSRLVNGFQSGLWNPFTDRFVVRASDAHSWVEAWLPGRGWTTFDPTPAAGPRSAAGLWLTRLSLYMDAAETFWQEWVLGYDLDRQAVLADRSTRVLGHNWLERAAGFAGRHERLVAAWLRRYGPPLLGCILLLALLARTGPRLIALVRMRRRVRRARQGQASVADATLLYTRMLELLRRRGYQKPAWFTPGEFAATLPRDLGALVGQFTAAYNALRFGAQTEAAPRLSLLLEQLERGNRR